MKTNNKFELQSNSRRSFIRQGSLLVSGAAVLVGNLSCQNQKQDEEEEGEEMVSANEDLMREHGLLQRMQLIYDAAIDRMNTTDGFNPDYINQTANIIRNFVEDYHEKLEENFLFPRLEKANREVGLVSVLRRQHKAGRDVTDQVINISKKGVLEDSERQNLINLMQSFNTMYRPHEAREDTILFPAFKQIISKNEYDSLGEEFEEKEHEKFGGDGFDMMVDKVAEIEKQIGIFELDKFTPKI